MRSHSSSVFGTGLHSAVFVLHDADGVEDVVCQRVEQVAHQFLDRHDRFHVAPQCRGGAEGAAGFDDEHAVVTATSAATNARRALVRCSVIQPPDGGFMPSG